MQGVVLAAGEGTRLRPLTADRPKGLVELAGKPLLSHCFEALLSAGVDELIVVVGYRGEQIVDRYGGAFRHVPVSYTRQENRRGLAHALLTAAGRVDGDVVVMNGDNVLRGNLGTAIERHRESDAAATLLVAEVSEQRARKGAVLEFDDEGRLAGLVEKPDDPPSRRIPRGVRVFSPRIFDACRRIDPSERGEYELTDAVDLLPGQAVEIVAFDGWCVNVNTAADLAVAARRLRQDAGGDE